MTVVESAASRLCWRRVWRSGCEAAWDLRFARARVAESALGADFKSHHAFSSWGRVPNGAGHVPAGEPEPAELVVWHEFLDQRKELSLLKPDVCVKQFPRRIQRLSIDAAGRHGDAECASEPLELHVLEACLAEERRLRLHVSEQKREELFFLIAKMDTLFVPEELHEFPGGREPSRSISVRGSTAQPHCLHEPVVR